jgi:hypothetical protein
VNEWFITATNWRMKMAKNVSKNAAEVVANVAVEAKVKKTFRFYKAGDNVDLSVKLPPQCAAILKFMKETNFRGTGPAIINAMIEKGLIQTRQEPAVLFAFYARKLESVGLIRE